MEQTIDIKSKLLVENYDDGMESGAFVFGDERIQGVLNELHNADFYSYKEFEIADHCSNTEYDCGGITYFVIQFEDSNEKEIEITGCTTCYHWCRSE